MVQPAKTQAAQRQRALDQAPPVEIPCRHRRLPENPSQPKGYTGSRPAQAAENDVSGNLRHAGNHARNKEIKRPLAIEKTPHMGALGGFQIALLSPIKKEWARSTDQDFARSRIMPASGLRQEQALR